jgi:hypothetical protein
MYLFFVFLFTVILVVCVNIVLTRLLDRSLAPDTPTAATRTLRMGV